MENITFFANPNPKTVEGTTVLQVSLTVVVCTKCAHKAIVI